MTREDLEGTVSLMLFFQLIFVSGKNKIQLISLPPQFCSSSESSEINMFNAKQNAAVQTRVSCGISTFKDFVNTTLTPAPNLANVNFTSTIFLNLKVLKVKQDLTSNVEFNRGKEKGERREMGGMREEELLRTPGVNMRFFYFLMYISVHSNISTQMI